MSQMQNIHSIQVNILLILLHRISARFSEMNDSSTPSDQFNFHLKMLLSQGMVLKNNNGLYELTDKGKEFANRFDTEAKTIERQAKLGVLICGVRKNRTTNEYLMQQRLKQPYFGYWGFITGKIRWGESIFETAKRELYEETGLTAKFELKGIKHKIDFAKEGSLLEDKFFYVLKASDCNGKLKTSFPGGKNKWLGLPEISRLKDLFGDVNHTFEIIRSKNMVFDEFKFIAERY